MNVRDETSHDIHKSAVLRYALLCIVTRLISEVHFHITGPKLTFNSLMSKHERGKCEKMCISSILRLESCITPLDIDTKWRLSNLTWRSWKGSHTKFQYAQACRRIKGTNGPHIVHLSTLSHLCRWICQGNHHGSPIGKKKPHTHKLGRGREDLTYCQVSLNSVQWF